MALLEVRDLNVAVPFRGTTMPLVRGVSFALDRGEIVGLVGESGCGKSTIALSLIGLLSEDMTPSGHVVFDGQHLLSLTESEMCQLRGNRISMIFQEPMTALNPLMTIGDQVAEPVRLHWGLAADVSARAAAETLVRAGFSDARERMRAYPHELSGGQRQRVVIAMALACNPDLIIADEPTTAVDATVQRRILDLLVDLVDRTGIGLLLITHNLPIVSEIADRVMIMSHGRIIETGDAEEILTAPQHPHTQGLLRALPQFGSQSGDRLKSLADAARSGSVT